MWKDRALRILRYATVLLSAGYLVWCAYKVSDFRAFGIDTIVPFVLIAFLALNYLILFFYRPFRRSRMVEAEENRPRER